MLGRVIIHIILLTILVALGVWLVYIDLLTSSEVNFTPFSGMLAAMYWFGFLIYALLVSLLFLMFKWRTWKSFILAHLFCAAIGMFSTAGVVALGQFRAEQHLITSKEHLEVNPETQAPRSPGTEAPRDDASPITTAPPPETDSAVTPGTSPQGLAKEPERTE